MVKSTNQNKGDNPWSEKVNEAFKTISSAIGFDFSNFRNLKDEDVKKLETQADSSSQHTKRLRDAATSYRKLIHSSISQNKIIQGITRQGLDAVKSIRSAEAKTAKHAAKVAGAIKVLDERTNKAIGLVDYATGKEIEAIGTQHETQKALVDQRYLSLGEYSEQRQQQALNDVQNRTQKRLEASKKPWRN